MVGGVFHVEVHRARTTNQGVRPGDGVDGNTRFFDRYVGRVTYGVSGRGALQVRQAVLHDGLRHRGDPRRGFERGLDLGRLRGIGDHHHRAAQPGGEVAGEDLLADDRTWRAPERLLFGKPVGMQSEDAASQCGQDNHRAYPDPARTAAYQLANPRPNSCRSRLR